MIDRLKFLLTIIVFSPLVWIGLKLDDMEERKENNR